MNKNFQQYLLYSGVLFFCSTLGFFLLSEISIGLSLILLIFVFTYIYLKLEKGLVTVLFLLPFVVMSFFSASMQVRDITYSDNCFEFNVSYPGTTSYDKCIQALNISDFTHTILTIRNS